MSCRNSGSVSLSATRQQAPKTSPRTAFARLRRRCDYSGNGNNRGLLFTAGHENKKCPSAKKTIPSCFSAFKSKACYANTTLLSNCIEIGLKKGIEAFDKYTLWALNYAAVSNIAQFGGRFREEPVYVGDHIPPHFKEVPHLMDQFFSFIHESWTLELENTLHGLPLTHFGG